MRLLRDWGRRQRKAEHKPSYATWVLGFGGSDHLPALYPLVNQDRIHIWMARWSPVGWIWVNWRSSLLDIDVLADEDEDPWSFAPANTTAIIRVRKGRRVYRQWFHFGPCTCVMMAKRLLGINKPFIFTPNQLYNYLIKGEYDGWCNRCDHREEAKRGEEGREACPETG